MSKLSEQLAQEVEKRRTFAIISHPDAGKTTLTEKLLLFGGAIRLAGTVKARKASKHATSDWMEIEKQRGISVTSSVMQFDYNGHRVNILDTPGHQDFSEDTYRTLTAADAAVMLIDVAKGVEAQTIKLFQVCAKRGIPIFTFINKLDREGRSPFELMEEIEQVLGIRSVPMNWPIGMGRGLCGVYDRMKNQVELFQDDNTKISVKKVEDYNDPAIRQIAGDYLHDQLCEELELLDVAGDEFDYEKVKRGELTPVFFGSAVNNFGVQTFLDNFLQLAPKPAQRQSTEGPIEPTNEKFTGYIFKIQANMNPAHRDRIAFLRICSGKFERGMSVKHVRAGKEIKLAQPQQFLAQDRDIVQEAFPGDIIGLFDPGIFRIGDSLSQGGEVVFDELPTFSPEIFARVTVKNALKHKQYQKGVDQLTEEGTIQVFHSAGVFDETILGVVGQLQFEVFEYRMKAEYGVDVMMQRLTYQFARWVTGNPKDIDPTKFRINSQLVKDKNGNFVALFENEYAMRTAMDKMPDLKFMETAP
ncbi:MULTISPECIES: peptide chain release factor 3 [Paenibacillus]|uniref:Peptide chain release factor 3 n=3 Tax=Paenibacillus TaxID=44249 RepID=A0AAJ2JZ13_9BACL|nr:MULTISPECIES: peptide chain release factor 3 [Paenibacillus]EPY12771.1 peptide chain release factor 3 [Paenibacillus alvei A6-6i-x]MCM3291855.1 peptide chain release factor 3 [Paenibacillus sp. MER 180]MCY9533017.1 peptide chain release factor 3 [Paenibacillus alvei]MDT8979488.1 peptide chain release factor 3 [Paenibacillus sp. chi10]OBY77106.1 peptide chain release factor 3 [Paenibacillus sp. KS1]